MQRTHTMQRREKVRESSPIVRWLLILLLLAGMAPVSMAREGEILLKADIAPLALRSRTAAPTFIDVKLHSRQRAILEGTLELRVMAGNRIIFRQQTRELALAPGVTTQRVFLPPVVANEGWELEAQLLFLSGKNSHDLGRFPFSDASSVLRQYLIGVCTTTSSLPQKDRTKLWQALRPEWILQDPANPTRWITSLPAFIAPEDLPSAMGLCAFDAIAVEGPSFVALDEKQLSQLATWVESGGSLCVAPTTPLGPEHLAFLNKLATAPGRPQALRLEPGGGLTLRDGMLLLQRCGLGRLVVALAPPTSETEILEPAWRNALRFLIKARQDSGNTPLKAGAMGLNNTSYSEVDRVSFIHATLFNSISNSFRTVPIPAVGGILVAFVLLVGPGEWFVLGRLKLRRWTWATFPLLALGFAWIGIRAAEHYLGRTDQQAAIVITDLGESGRVFRENRLELRFAGRSTIARSELQQSIAVPCAGNSDFAERGSADSTPLYQGTVPIRYTLHQPLEQWKPLLQRTMTFAGEPPGIDWGRIDDPKFTATGLVPQSPLFEQFRAQGWTVQVLHRGKVVIFDQNSGPGDLLSTISRMSDLETGLWTAMLAPSGRADLRDLPIHDPSDPHEWLLIATRTNQRTLQVVRRLYRTDE